jgi:hypothetical protein
MEFVNLEWILSEREKGCHEMSFWQHISIPLGEVLLLCNSSANFFIYVVFDKAFQMIIVERFSFLKRCFHCSISLQTETIPPKGRGLFAYKDDENALNGNEIELLEANKKQEENIETMEI